jgi:hypothetical protein
MYDYEQFSQRLKQSFERVLSDPIVRAWEGDFAMILVSVVSPTFEEMDELERQLLVWDRVLEDLGPEDRTRIEFIYTDTPAEVAPEEDDSRTIMHD